MQKLKSVTATTKGREGRQIRQYQFQRKWLIKKRRAIASEKHVKKNQHQPRPPKKIAWVMRLEKHEHFISMVYPGPLQTFQTESF